MTAVSGHRIRQEIAEVFNVDPGDPAVIELHRRVCSWIEAMRAGMRAIVEEQAGELRHMRAYHDAAREEALERLECSSDGVA